MDNKLLILAVVMGLSACSGDGNPFEQNNAGATTDEVGAGESFTPSTAVPPGTASPTAASAITRFEPRDSDGNGFVRSVRYTGPVSDTFIVDGLAFDAANVYQGGTSVSELANQYSVYEAATPSADSVTADPIAQLGYRAIYGVSRNTTAQGDPATEFAIVRTGSYVNYGFGGFLYERNGSVTLPQTGQATFTGNTAGIRDFDGQTGLQYTTGNLTIDIDFQGFNESGTTRGDGVRGLWSDRRVLNAQGVDITRSVLNGLNPDLVNYPTATFVIEPGALRSSGDLTGQLGSSYADENGDVIPFEEGSYYAVVSGSDPSEIAGVIVVTSSTDDATVRETAGFIVYRGADNFQ